MTRLAVINESKRVTDAQVDLIVGALKIQMRDYCAKAGLRTPTIARYRGAPKGTVPMVIVDNPDIAGALGYHDVAQDGSDYMRIFVDPILDNGGSVVGDRGDPSLSVSGCASHEDGETAFDPDCNRWADTAEPGVQIALENSDPVQGDAYFVEVHGQRVAVSNLVLPAWFNPKAKTGPFDLMGKLSAPFTMTKGGYWIERDFRGREVEKFGRVTARQFHANGTIVSAFGDMHTNPGRGDRTRRRLAQTRAAAMA